MFVSFYFTDYPRELTLLKVQITKDALEAINNQLSAIKNMINADADNLPALKIEIENSSKVISDLMIDAMKKLADIVDVDYFDVLSKVFGNPNIKNVEKINFVYNEVTKIYENGDAAFRFFQNFLETHNFWNKWNLGQITVLASVFSVSRTDWCDDPGDDRFEFFHQSFRFFAVDDFRG